MILLNPGPVTLTQRVRKSLLKQDICHREPEFIELQENIRKKLLQVYLLNSSDWAPILVTGSGTSAVEAMLTSCIPKGGNVLVIENGVYGERMSEILRAYEIEHERFAEIANDVGAKLFVDMAHYSGLVAAGLHHNPVEVADFVTTTTHKTLRGPRSGLILCREEYSKGINRSVFPGLQGGPLMHIVAAKAICFAEAMTDDFKRYGQSVITNAKQLAETLTAGGLRLISGGTDNHLMLVDVTPLSIGGKVAEEALDQCGITVNKNMIPFDERKPADPSGIRIGTPALTTRGMGSSEFEQIGRWILDALKHVDDEARLSQIQQAISELCQHFPVPGSQQESVELAAPTNSI